MAGNGFCKGTRKSRGRGWGLWKKRGLGRKLTAHGTGWPVFKNDLEKEGEKRCLVFTIVGTNMRKESGKMTQEKQGGGWETCLASMRATNFSSMPAGKGQETWVGGERGTLRERQKETAAWGVVCHAVTKVVLSEALENKRRRQRWAWSNSFGPGGRRKGVGGG